MSQMEQFAIHTLIHADGERYFDHFRCSLSNANWNGVFSLPLSFQRQSNQGFVVINGFNLGRHWPLAGPQMSMYLPKEILKMQNNSIIVVELEQAPDDRRLNFIDSPLYMHVISDEI